MKIRSSFVANSSSSSFLIGLKKLPNSLEESGEIFFGKEKDFVAPIVIKTLFEDIKQIDVNFDYILDKIKKCKSVSKLDNYREDISKNDEIIREVLSNYMYNDKNDWKGYWCSSEPSNFEQFEKEELDKLSIPKEDYRSIWKAKEKITDKWYNKKENKEKLVRHFEVFINQFKELPIVVEVSYADDSTIGSEMEHGSHWDRMTAVRFSHH